MKRSRPDRALALLLSLVPGAGHLLLGKRGRGIHLLVFAVGMALVLIWRWGAFVEAFSSSKLAAWMSARFLIVALVASVFFSVRDVWAALFTAPACRSPSVSWRS